MKASAPDGEYAGLFVQARCAPMRNGAQRRLAGNGRQLVRRDLRAAVRRGTRDLTPDQQLLADASGNGVVTTFDAARILQASTGAVMPGSHCGQLIQLP
jgi:hypothetical protein